MSKESITDYTEAEFLNLLKKIAKADAPSEKALDDLVDHFEVITQHPDGSDLIYYPENPEDGKPESIVRIVKEWRLSQGLPGFKS
ncbi:bacteriocin immunity protein [Vibrio aestuarianus]|uniref:bacteriocin immunity protein n=1 Tax=Vibrio aestuarianus TaxID=28171 RepID=UPI00237C899D|nr:bacteriocin immunity protein [Vibrio aestuarianus]MDE1265820.1 bacteriocin immunity protein [Vibrio aestuarianus]MDE1297922.1 bacteriocin immunity protein [Vibrio aestuarianus]